MVGLEGFEPSTHGLGILYTILILKKINNLARQNADKSGKIHNPAVTKNWVEQGYLPPFCKSIPAGTAVPERPQLPTEGNDT
jgi:hypothetical protein